jgi:hypothetical protein
MCNDPYLFKSYACEELYMARLHWHEVRKVDHYYLSIDAVTQPMQLKDPIIPYGEDREK